MPFLPYAECLRRLRKEVDEGRPIIGAGAGTGISAKFAERGGVDLIIIYNSGRFRMAGRGSLSGLMPYGDANAIVVDMASEVLPVVKDTPVLAGICGTDPFRMPRAFLPQLKALGFDGVQNFPTVGLIDGHFRQSLEETGMGIQHEIDWIAMAELFGTKWSKAGFTWLDVIPVDRHGDDRQALRTAIKRLEAGRMIGIFPEGGIRDGARSILSGAEMREGAFLLAAKARCPVVPVVILGSERLYNRRNWLPWRRARVYIAIGEPVFPSEGGRNQLRDDTAAALRRLKDQLMAACHLGENDLPHSPQERMREP